MNKKILYALLIILVETLIIYANSLYNGYNMDDSLVLTNNNLVKTGDLLSIFTQYSYQSSTYNFAYRPLVIVSFYLENLWFGQSSLVGHSISLLLYVVLNSLVFLWLYKISDNWLNALLITLLFVSFPLHTEVVDNIKNRDELLVSIFGFLALYATLNAIKTDQRRYFLLIFGFSTIGFLLKQSFVIFPPIIAATALLYYREHGIVKKAKIFVKYITLSGAAILVNVIIKLYFLDKMTINRDFELFENPLFHTSITERILPATYIIGKYVFLLFNPFKLSYYYGYNAVDFTNYQSLVFLLGVLLITTIPVVLWYVNRINKILLFGCIILMINLLSVSNWIQPIAGIVGERLLFNGTLGYCILLYYSLFFVASKLKTVKFRKPIIIVGSLVLITFYSKKTISRNAVWKDEFTLYKHDIKNVPNSAKANEMLAGSYYKNYFKDNEINNIRLSEQYYLKAIEIYPKYPTALHNLGTINYFKKNYKVAIDYFLQSLALKDKASIHYNLATCYQGLNKIDMAKREYEFTLLNAPETPNLFSAYKDLIITNKLIPEAVYFIESKMLTTHKNNLNTYLLLVDLNKETGDYKSMLKYLKVANKINPNEKYIEYIQQISSYLENS